MSNRNRKVVIVRHGERVDHLFTDSWVAECFDKDGNYQRQNLNQPEVLPQRPGFPQTFIRDSPITEVGLLQATLRGKGIAEAKVFSSDDFEVVSSPSLRCIQTATNILKAMNIKAKIKIEPALFEWTKLRWYLNGNMPNWMTPVELKQVGFDVDPSYVSFMSPENMKDGESVESFYSRSHGALLHILKATGNKDLLLIGHGFSFEVLTRQILGFPMRSESEMLAASGLAPYCGMLVLEQDDASKEWKILPTSTRLQLMHKSAHVFDACKTFTEND